MTSHPILAHWALSEPKKERPACRPGLRDLGLDRPASLLPRFVRRSALAMRYLPLCSVPSTGLQLPERNLPATMARPPCPIGLLSPPTWSSSISAWCTCPTCVASWSSIRPSAGCLGSQSLPALAAPAAHRSTPVSHSTTPGTHAAPDPQCLSASLLDQTVSLLRAELIDVCPDFGTAISLDTKHVIAWVKENNPKAYQKRSDASTRTTSPPAIPTAAWAASASTTSAPKLRAAWPRHSTMRSRPKASRSANTTGAMAPASSPPRSLAGVSLCLPN